MGEPYVKEHSRNRKLRIPPRPSIPRTCSEDLPNRAAPGRAGCARLDWGESARPETRPSASRILAVLGGQGKEGAASLLGPAGDLGDEGATDSMTAVGIRDGHRQDPCLLSGMVRPPLAAAEVAVELELGAAMTDSWSSATMTCRPSGL
jgi:hypothetical protein